MIENLLFKEWLDSLPEEKRSELSKWSALEGFQAAFDALHEDILNADRYRKLKTMKPRYVAQHWVVELGPDELDRALDKYDG